MSLTEKELIKDTAYSLFKKNSCQLAEIDEIIKESNLALKAFYHHFENKEEVYLDIVEDFWKNGVNFVSSSLKKDDNIDKAVKQIMNFAFSDDAMMEIAILSPLTIERNVSKERLIEFKKNKFQRMEKLSLKISELSNIDSEIILKKLYLSVSVLFSVWVGSRVPETITEEMNREEIRSQHLNFEEDTREVLEKVWA